LLLAGIVKAIRAYDATEWEIFTRECAKGMTGYEEVKRLGGAGDHGRDVIGLCSPAGCSGVWDNVQCKNYEGLLQPSTACRDAGKIIFHAYRGVFTPPRRCRFAAPKGPTTALRDLLLNPARFRQEVISTWNTRVANHVVDNEIHLLEGKLEEYVLQYDFSSFGYLTIEELLDWHRQTGYWAQRFGGLLPPPPPADAPPEALMPHETIYVGKLLDVYAEAAGSEIKTVSDLDAHAAWRDDLQKQRVRFFEAEAFLANYRDQTEPGTTESFADQIFDVIEPGLALPGTGMERLTKALTAAGQTTPASVLSAQAKVGVKQGVCHQLANDNRVTWKV
jgi:hypothetical protein